MIFQSTPSAWRETARKMRQNAREFISIHSLRVEGDAQIPRQKRCPCQFQSTPSAWRETFSVLEIHRVITFQSTPSAWRETILFAAKSAFVFISIHSLRVEGDQRGREAAKSSFRISIHSLRVEGDSKNSQITDAFYKAKSEFSQKAVLIIA